MHNARVFGALGLMGALVASTALLTFTPACQDRRCIGSGKDWGRHPGEGALIDPDTWESSPADGKWLHYPGQRTWFMYPGGFARRKVSRVTVYISPHEAPNAPQSSAPNAPYGQYTVASGNVASVTQFPDPGDKLNPGLGIHNDTCADYYVRVVVEAYPVGEEPNEDAGSDASSDADANVATADATFDSSTDASSDGASE